MSNASRHHRSPLRHLATIVAVVVLAPAWRAGAVEDPPPGQEIAELRAQISDLRRTMEVEIAALEERIRQLESTATANQAAPATAATAPSDALAALREAARAAAGEATPSPAGTPTSSPAAGPVGPAVGHERNLNRLNPEISFTGDLLGRAANDSREEFDAREFELNLQSNLDPYSFTKVTLSIDSHGAADVEEGYIAYRALPGGLTLQAGKFRQQFGLLNRWHQHALPQVDLPLVLTSYFGPEGLDQTGLSIDWLVPHGWADTNELALQVTDGENEIFGGESFRRLSLLGHVKSYWDLSPATYLEWGLSGITGGNGSGGTSRVWGSDLTLHWQPPQRAKYREITWRSELLRSQRNDALGIRRDAWGGYSYVEGLVHQNLYAGARLDRVEDPLAPDEVEWSISPYLTWWESEFVRLRSELGYLHDDLLDRSGTRFLLQATWAAGPHKHETY